MLNFCSLYSGSSGNSLFVETENTRILVDAGMSCKKIEEALQSIEVNPSSINAILVTHEHSDHVKGISTISRKFDIPVFSTKETFEAMPAQTEKLSEKNISIATDIGHMTKSIVNHLEGSQFILLESNYDTNVLKCCSYPYKLKTRIAGDRGHLSNTMAGKTISYLLKNSNLATAMLGHLSKESNFPELAYQTVVDEIISNHSKNSQINLSVANRNCPSKLITL